MRSIFLNALLLTGATFMSASPAQAATAPWMDNAFDRRIQFNALPDSIEGSGDFTDFTLLVDLSDPAFSAVFTNADPNGADLVVTAGDGFTPLFHEVVSYDAVAGEAEIWFKAPVLSDLENEFFLYYANSTLTAARGRPPISAWTWEHLAVYHYAEDPTGGVLKDWGPNANDAIAAVAPAPVGPGWTSSNLVDGMIGKGWFYDGVDLWTYANSVSSADSNFTISAWFANDAAADKGAMAFQNNDTVWDMSFQASGGVYRSDMETPNGQIVWSPDTVDSDLHHYAWILDGEADTLRFYYDGIERAISSRWTPPGEDGPVYTAENITSPIGIASPYAFNLLDLADGIVDEFRIFEGVRDADWVRTEFRNQHDPIGFYTVAPEELSPGPPTGVGANGLASLGQMTVTPNPFRAVAWIEVESDATRLEVNIYDAKGRLVRTLRQPRELGLQRMRYLWNGRDQAGSKVSNGIYYIRATDGRSVASSKAVLVR